MGQVIPFSGFKKYYESNRCNPDFAPGTILDTNILIALTYEVKSNHEEITSFFKDHLLPEWDLGFRLFTTVNTRSEFLDFNRRLAMTERLRDMIDDHSK